MAKLFSQDFLFDGIRSTPVWEALTDATLGAFHADLKKIYAPLVADSSLNEANTDNCLLNAGANASVQNSTGPNS
jgi:hypothetical protein